MIIRSSAACNVLQLSQHRVMSNKQCETAHIHDQVAKNSPCNRSAVMRRCASSQLHNQNVSGRLSVGCSDGIDKTQKYKRAQRHTSSSTMRDRDVARARISDVSCSSTKKVLRPRAMSSDAPMLRVHERKCQCKILHKQTKTATYRVNTASKTPTRALSAGTNDPI